MARAANYAVKLLSTWLAYLSGLSFLLLAFYVTYDTLARDFGWPYTGISDEISSYVLGIGGTWAMAYGLQVGAHVRIDLIIQHATPRLRRALDVLATAVTTIFAGLLAAYGWRQTFEAHALSTRSITPLRTLLEIPQGMIALGFTLLAVQAFLMLISGSSASFDAEEPI